MRLILRLCKNFLCRFFPHYSGFCQCGNWFWSSYSFLWHCVRTSFSWFLCKYFLRSFGTFTILMLPEGPGTFLNIEARCSRCSISFSMPPAETPRKSWSTDGIVSPLFYLTHLSNCTLISPLNSVFEESFPLLHSFYFMLLKSFWDFHMSTWRILMFFVSCMRLEPLRPDLWSRCSCNFSFLETVFSGFCFWQSFWQFFSCRHGYWLSFYLRVLCSIWSRAYRFCQSIFESFWSIRQYRCRLRRYLIKRCDKCHF